jgi:AraC-like DNA-binding protein
MDDVASLIRGAAIGMVLLLAAVFRRSRSAGSLARVGTLFAAGAIGYLLWSDPAISTWPPLARLVIGIAALSAPFFFWALTRLIFEDDFRLRPAHWALLGVIVVAGVAQSVLPAGHVPWSPDALRTGFRLLMLALIVHAFWVVGKGWPTDLVEKRVRLRLIFLVGAGTAAALVVLAALVYAPAAARPHSVRLGEAGAFALLILTFGVILMRFDQDVQPPERAPDPPGRQPHSGPGVSPQPEPDLDAGVLERLASLMRADEAWRETGLTIGGLATRVGIPEYRLRRLINQRLGHRNFTAYLNEYRLGAAAARLADREQMRTPVLTIALELGWGSIGPFNRAFRARFDMTPSDYRRQRTTQPHPDENSAPIC